MSPHTSQIACALFASLLTLSIPGVAFGQGPGISPDPFLQSEEFSTTYAAPDSDSDAGEWTAPDSDDNGSGRHSAEAMPPIYSPDENPEDVLQPAGYQQSSGREYGSPIHHSTDAYNDGMLEAVSTRQSPEFPGAPDPTPLEGGQPPPYTFLPDPQPEQEAPVHPNFLFRQSRFIGTWLPAGSNEIGMSDVDMQSTLVVPALGRWTLTPGFQTHFLNGPTRTDLPAQLYNARVEFGYAQQLDPRFAMQLAIAPGIYTDSENTSSDAFRVTGRVLGFYVLQPQTQLLLGLAYLDREDLRVLPAFGVIHTPAPDYRLEMVFPKPKLAYRLSQIANATQAAAERWVYLSGEFGGGSWAIERANGAEDIATYSDWRLILGMESKAPTGPGWLVEVGYVFKRELEYDSGPGSFDPESTGMLRAGVTY